MSFAVVLLLSAAMVAVLYASQVSVRRRLLAGAVPSDPELRKVHDRLTRSRLLGLLLGLAAFGALVLLDGSGRTSLAAPALLGLGALVGVALTITRADESGRTSADARPPRPPRALTLATTIVWLLLVVTAAVTTLTASADGSGTAGRSFAVRCGSNLNLYGPYPGSFVTLPLAVVLVVALALAGLTLRRSTAARDVEATVAALLVTGGAALAALTIAVAVAASALSSPAGECEGLPWAQPLASGAALVTVAVAGLAVLGVSLLLVPSRPPRG